MKIYHVSWTEVHHRAMRICERFDREWLDTCLLNVYPVPKAGIHAAQAVQAVVNRQELRDTQVRFVEDPLNADIYIDDVYDSGDTIKRICDKYGSKPAYFLVNKQAEGITDWVSFPWDRMTNDSGPEDNIKRILEYIGENPNREGLKETPSRVVKSYADLFSGYQYQTDEDVSKLMKCFVDGACDEMVLLKNIEFVSFCEHHVLPFTGQAHIAYLPQGKVVGVSKLARVLDVYSRRLQIQEKLTQQVTRALDMHLEPLGSACIIEAVHECMTCRGVRKQNSVMVTSSLTGEFRNQEVRQELLALIKG